MDLKENLALAQIAAKEAGKYLNEIKFKTKNVLVEKGRDIKLEADREAEKIIRHILKKSKIPVLGEEYGEDEQQGQYKWIVDPLDGTSNFFRGIDQCCVCIALSRNKDIIIGVIYNFNSDDMYYAAKDLGAFLNDSKISVSNITTKSSSSLTTGFPSSESIESSIQFLKDLSDWKKIRMFGSAGLSCAYVASGKCDFYAEKGVYFWDFAAGVCLVKEAGGKVDYEKISENTYSVELSNGKL